MGEDMTYTTEPTRAQLVARVAELERENAELRECGEYFANWLLEDVSRDTPQYPTFDEFLTKWQRGELVEWKAKIDKMYDDAMQKRLQPVPADDDTDAPLKPATVEDGE